MHPVPTTEWKKGSDRAEFAIHVGEQLDLGAESCVGDRNCDRGHILGIDPFDEPTSPSRRSNTSGFSRRFRSLMCRRRLPTMLRAWLTEQREQGD